MLCSTRLHAHTNVLYRLFGAIHLALLPDIPPHIIIASMRLRVRLELVLRAAEALEIAGFRGSTERGGTLALKRRNRAQRQGKRKEWVRGRNVPSRRGIDSIPTLRLRNLAVVTCTRCRRTVRHLCAGKLLLDVGVDAGFECWISPSVSQYPQHFHTLHPVKR